MLEVLTAPFTRSPAIDPIDVAVRLTLALVLGIVVAAIYRHTRSSTEIMGSFPTTLVLLSVLIAMVTQVIGDNVARAFSLVGALSIVRFRTVVRDTQDTAYVIFAVVVGMAVGAQNLWIALIGIVVIAIEAFVRKARAKSTLHSQPAFWVNLQIALGLDVEATLGPLLDMHFQQRELMSASTGKMGAALEVVYETRLRPGGSPAEFVKALNRIEGVQRVQVKRSGFEFD